ncbi:hypothetical protein [Sphingomonas montana]|uniref:hypothetical protein n=1 Tax=Sphingomonas montana TaxID=1843236 RepID=UPI00101AEB33|nr:hypothetical protein [Sphingomonas montana]
MNFFRILLPALGLAVAGCTSVNAILAKEADEVFHSKLSSQQVADCFEQANNFGVIERPDGARVAQFRNGYGGIVKLFSIYPEGTGSRIEARHSFVGVPGMR